jgi:hypothetical protein
MGTAFGILEWIVFIAAIVSWRSHRKQGRAVSPSPKRRAPVHPRRMPAAPVAGWMLGHAVAHDHHGFPGDPLPHGHLGSPANLAFWGSALADDEDDEI